MAIPALLFLGDGFVLAVTAWILVRVLKLERAGLVEVSLAWLVLALAWIVSSGILLGWCGHLGPVGFFTLHVLGLAGLLSWRRRLAEDVKEGANWLENTWWNLRHRELEGLIGFGFIVVVLLLGNLAVRAEPMVFDSLTYRLPRIALWLQEGVIGHFQTDDPRLNYMPMGPDLVIAWLIGSRPDGFLLAPLSQLSGGVLLLGATFGLARLTDLSQRTALGAMVLVLGMANVAVQFTTVQSDLFTAGVFSASFFLWHRSLLRGESSAVAGIGLALAFGSKGTMFYFAPGAVLWIICLAWKHRIPWKAGLITVSWAAVAALVFVGPSLWRNFQTYGGLFGPREAVVQQHGRTLSLTQQVDKLALNLCSSGVQLFDPNAQPYWMQGFCRSAGQRITRMLSNETDPYIFMEVSRRAQLEQVMEFTEPDCDLLTCGIQAVLLFFWGLTIAVIFRSRFKGASLILVWGAGVLLFLLVQHTMVQWHHWSFRFMVLAAPWVAVVSAWGVSKLPRKLRVGVWTIAIFSSLQVFVVVQWRSPQAAWRAVTAPDHTLAHFVYHRWRDWTRTLDPAGSGITLALPINEPIAAFTRMGDGRLIALQRMKALPATAESAVQSLDGWLVVPVGYFNGREGRVEKRVWILNGDEQSQFSLAAYRRLEVKR